MELVCRRELGARVHGRRVDFLASDMSLMPFITLFVYEIMIFLLFVFV
jgi:hypothetical protein